jgi:hypothetical protein
MAQVRYVCLSDLHLGEEDSVLSNMNEDGTEGDPAKPGPLLEQLALCIKNLAGKFWTEKPTLVLNGDALELALCPLHRASMAFQCFINQLKDGDGFLFENILLVPGNHDHHLWVMTREDQYRDYLQRHKQGRDVVIALPEQWHSTKLFPKPKDKPVICHYLTDLIRRPPVNLDLKVQVAYPNLGIIKEKKLKPNQIPEKCVVFHHGHFTEWIYGAMGTVKDWIFDPNDAPARHVWKLEKENFAWIDFAWSALGQSWDSGQGLETVYEKTLDNRKFGEVLANLSAGLAKEIGTQSFDWFEGAIIDKFLKLIYGSFAGSEKGQTDATLSQNGLKQLFHYSEGPLHAQICYDIVALQQGEDELDERVYSADFFKDTLAPQTTLILGHTHKPFASHEGFHGYSGGVDVYNSGGWVVESLDSAPLHGGSIILVDDQLNVAAIRMYNENADDRPLPVRLEPPPYVSLQNPLAAAIDKLNFPEDDPWKTFSEMVASIIRIRRKYLRQRVFSNLPKQL